jgi:hypothetical protein
VVVSRDKRDLLVHAGVQLVEAGEDVRQIDHGGSQLIDLVEYIVPEELDHVAIASLGPPRIVVEPYTHTFASVWNAHNNYLTTIGISLGTLVDKSKLAQQSHEAPVLEFTHQLALQQVRIAGHGPSIQSGGPRL